MRRVARVANRRRNGNYWSINVGRGRETDAAVVSEWVQHEPVSLGGNSDKRLRVQPMGGMHREWRIVAKMLRCGG